MIRNGMINNKFNIMKTVFEKTKSIDENGWTLRLMPSLLVGWENYGYLKVIQIDFSFLVWELLFEIHFK